MKYIYKKHIHIVHNMDLFLFVSFSFVIFVSFVVNLFPMTE
jgi:hypothetical protein